MFAVPDESTVEIVSSQQHGTCPGMPEAAIKGCDATYDLVVNYEADFYLCTDDQAQATADGCPKSAWQFLQRATLKNVKIDNWQHHFSGKDIVRAGWQSLFGDVPGAILFSFFAEDLMDCLHGSKTACAWSLATYVPVEGLLTPIARAVKALDAAARTGIGFEDAYKALRALDGLSEAAIVSIGNKALNLLKKGCVHEFARRGIRAAGGGYCKWLELGGPGTWMAETENMAQADRAYEQMVTNGVPSGISYKVPADWRKSGYVKFDGYQDGALIDAKNQALNDRMFTPDGKLQKWVTEPVKQAKDQARAAGDTPIIWYVSDERTATAFKHMMIDNDLKTITVIYRAGPQ